MFKKRTEPEFTEEEFSPTRKAIAKRVTDSFRDIPQFDIDIDVDCSNLLELRNKSKEEVSEEILSYNDMMIYALSRTLLKHPLLNMHYIDNSVRKFEEVNIGFAIATPLGVLLPVIRNAHTKTLNEISKESKEMVELAMNKKLRASFQMYGTFTLSSLGGFKINSFNAIVSPPQVAILAAGAIIKKPYIKNDKLSIGNIMKLTLTVDHRAIDGADGAAFLRDLKSELEGI